MKELETQTLPTFFFFFKYLIQRDDLSHEQWTELSSEYIL